MAYSVSNIIDWSKISQPLARYYEAKKKAFTHGVTINDKDLDIKIYNTRKDIEYAYAQDPDSDETYQQANFLLSLIGVYLFQAQAATGGGGSITPITPGTSIPEPYEFEVDGTSFIATGDSGKQITAFRGYNIIFVRNNITQSQVNQGGTYFTWDRASGTFSLGNGSANAGELFQIYPVL